MHTVLITCQRRALDPLIAQADHWEATGDASIVLYGYTNKAQDGFVLMHWKTPITEEFQQQHLKANPDITDYLVYNLAQYTTT